MHKFDPPIRLTKPLLPSLDSYKEELSSVWESSWLTNFGSQHHRLESELKDYLKVEKISLVNNGTIALMLAIKALKLTGEVITTPFTFPATPHAITWNNLKPVFCDISPDSLTIDPDKIADLITPHTSAILGVHVYGVPCAVDKIEAIAKKHGLKVIYDAAHAFSTKIDGRPISDFGDITAFSFHATKLFHSCEGGGLVYKDSSITEQLNALKNFGLTSEETVIAPGINGKLNELQASMGILVLNLVYTEQSKRKIIRDKYSQLLSGLDGLKLVELPNNITNSEQYLAIRIDNDRFSKTRDQVYNSLREHGVLARRYFYPLVSSNHIYQEQTCAKLENLPVANKICNEILCLPFYGDLTDFEVESICSLIKN